MEVFSKLFFILFCLIVFSLSSPPFLYPFYTHPFPLSSLSLHLSITSRFHREHGSGGRHLHCEHRVGYSQRGGLEIRRDRSKSAGVQSNSESELLFSIVFSLSSSSPEKGSSLQIVWRLPENLLLPMCHYLPPFFNLPNFIFNNQMIQ